ncbi:polyprenyl synthetase family protein [Bacillus thermotolerans]|uniref:Farnesyl diphosphate synthase n=1 Tax=Bacillus thermotolerans TaxID=1221996 RepID=A0A0F5HV31_BACTR|nr:farnesyl diphosphate synthase [Bacillus thermotolerans]KKB37239.1 (2E,6E)-farnesyl diphosphate synthase [Bacillus thermotolerans]KKB42963.1 (2E,6E)-farnesyl diphosphate synthase [Bacillus thermotolerans]
MAEELSIFMKEYKEVLESELSAVIERLDAPETLKKSMNYSLQAGGKRIRPVLLFAALASLGKDPKLGLEAAAALEMIHTYSLIHDDLPSMDDDDLRRGQPTNHKVFGEAAAILAGDALLTYAFQVIVQSPHYSSEQKVTLVEWLAQAAGPEGMVGGQMSDMEGEGKELTLEELEYIHKNKTGRLLTYGVMAGALLAGANEEQLAHFKNYAFHVGIAFQIQDDILDVEGSEEKIGKRIGSDTAKEKSTYPALLTMEGAKEALNKHADAALTALQYTKADPALLSALVELIVTRDR